MAKTAELGREYARQIRLAKAQQLQVDLSKSAAEKRASATTPPPAFKSAVVRVLKDLDAQEVAQRPISEDLKKQILAETDEALGLKAGTMYWIKKGSVESTLMFDQYLMQLYSTIDFI